MIGGASRHRRGSSTGAAVSPLLLFLLALSIAAGWPVAGAETLAVQSMLEWRRDRVVVQEWDLSCGAAALATILNYQFGDMVSERDIALTMMRRREYVEHPELVRVRQGFSLLDLKRFVEARGYRGYGIGKLKLEELERLAPAIVPVNHHGYDHFVVYRGRYGGRVLVADPAWGNVSLTLDQFEDRWKETASFGRVAFAVRLPGSFQLPNYLAPTAGDLLTIR